MSSCSEQLPELRRCRPLLGTFVEITVRGGNPAAQLAGSEAAFAAIARVQTLLSYHDAASELSCLNREAAHQAVRVDPWTRDVLLLAQRIHTASGGCFDPAIAPLLERAGLLPRPVGARRVSEKATFADVHVEKDGRVRFLRPLRVDLGGIAKGFAVDRAIDALRGAGISTALVNAGGDLRAIGDSIWPIAVRHPARPGSTHALAQLRDGAVATSAVYFSRRRTSSGRWTSAIMHPHLRRPWLGRASVTVQAPEAVTADALTKVVALQGPVRAEGLLAAFDAHAIWLDPRPRHIIPQLAPCAA